VGAGSGIAGKTGSGSAAGAITVGKVALAVVGLVVSQPEKKRLFAAMQDTKKRRMRFMVLLLRSSRAL
jgi:hypothetical protein